MLIDVDNQSVVGAFVRGACSEARDSCIAGPVFVVEVDPDG